MTTEELKKKILGKKIVAIQAYDTHYSETIRFIDYLSDKYKTFFENIIKVTCDSLNIQLNELEFRNVNMNGILYNVILFKHEIILQLYVTYSDDNKHYNFIAETFSNCRFSDIQMQNLQIEFNSINS